ncbi:hypothetical protein KGF56_001613 [Candida oxycetoniae]|uniref:Uncharacterized protein n=1 Tax=Candida oxycetoniae TaxID=497107 RepID=A0AAI9T066_9ASCO|nr:uncharacterized protein KGF56_001613 [Candida oxycetoniae]KAI3405595.2 hypothetical protein KGF56_001613 [Candida oxycetoniae]
MSLSSVSKSQRDSDSDISKTTYKISLDLYPQEILDEIVKLAGLENLIQLISSIQFLEDNTRLQNSIDKLILQYDGRIQYNNRIKRPSFMHMYLRTPSFIEKKNLLLLRNYLHFISLQDYCIYRKIKTTLTIAYYFWTFAEVVNLFDLMDKLSSSGIVHYQVDFEFGQEFLYLIDFQQIIDQLEWKCGQTVKTMILTNCQKQSNMCRLDLQNLWLTDCAVMKFRKECLVKLHLSPSFRSGKDTFSLKFIPPSMEYLYLNNNVTILGGDDNIVYSLPSLKSMNLDDGLLEHWSVTDIVKLFKGTLSAGHLERISYTPSPHSSTRETKAYSVEHEVIELLNQHQQLKILHSLHLTLFSGRSIPHLWNLPNLTELSISVVNNESKIINRLEFPQTVRDLNLNYCNIEDLSILFDKFPLGLQKLNLADNSINWSLITPNFAKFEKLKYLRLFNTHIGSNIINFTFPDSLEQLSLEVNQIESIDEVKFPKNLINLGIGSNKLKTIYKPRFPQTIKTVHLTENLLKKVDLSTNDRGQPLQIEILYLNYNRLNDIKSLKLPTTLKILNLNSCFIRTIEDYEFAPSIEELSIMGCNLLSIDKVTFGAGSKLKYCCLSQNEISKLNGISFPQSVENINLSRNRLTQIPQCLQCLQNVKYLNLSTNKIRSAAYKFQTSSIETLDLSYNSIKKLRLRFPRHPPYSNLVSLNLSWNELSHFDNFSIDGNVHVHILEIDLSCNKNLSIQSIKEYEKFAPPTLQYLMFETINNKNIYGGPIGYKYAYTCIKKEAEFKIIQGTPKQYKSRVDQFRPLLIRKKIDYPSVS